MSSVFMKVLKGVKCVFSVGFGISVCWCVDGGVVAGNDCADRIAFGVDYRYDIGFNEMLFYGYSVDKPMAYI